MNYKACFQLVILNLLHIWIFSNFLVSSESTDKNEKQTLQLVQMVFRHGDKNPEVPYPNDPYKNESFWKGGLNYITDKGKLRLYNLGIYFRERYSTLLSQEYLQNEMLALSSDTDRTVISGMSFLTGLYKRSNLESGWSSDLHWEPIPIRTIEKKHDRMIEMTEPCPKIDEILNDLLFNSEWTKKLIKDNEEIVEFVANNSGVTETNFWTISNVVQTLEIQAEHGLELPTWTDQVFESKPLIGMLMAFHKELHKNKLWTSLRSGPLTQKLINNMEDNIKNENEYDRKKMILFSSHDRTLVDIMLALNIYDMSIEKPPPYGSALIFELHRSENQHFIDVLYKNDSSTTPYTLTVPGCGSPCYIVDFKRIATEFISENWKQDCQI